MALTHQGVQSVEVTLVCFIVSALAVTLRFWCKLVLKTGLHGDDWWSLAAVIAHAGLTCAYVWGKSRYFPYQRDTRSIFAENNP